MQTYSHLILTAAMNGRFGRLTQTAARRLPPMHTGALLLGSVLPDLLLIGLGAAAIGRDLITGVFQRPEFAAAPGAPPSPDLLEASMTMKLFEVWFYENPWVIAAQNLFHSPLLLALLLAAGYAAWRHGRRRGRALFWLACAALLHTLIDIPLHVDDGPLLLFPLNWRWRFESAISYWDPAYYGREWSIFEHLFDAALLVYLGVHYREGARAWWRRHLPRRAGSARPRGYTQE